MFHKERGRQVIKYYSIWLQQIQRTTSLDNSQKSSIRLHCLKWQNVRVIFANKVSKDFLGLASLWMICEITCETLIAAVVPNTNILGLYFQLVLLPSTHLHTVNFSKEYFMCSRSVCKPGPAGWCAGLVNSFQKDIWSEQESVKSRE